MWQIILGIGIAFLLLEIFMPSSFFINCALACLVCALLSLITTNITYLIVSFVVLSFVFLVISKTFFKNFALKNNSIDNETGIKSKYIGKTATVTEQINSQKGAVSIYDERWQARSNDTIEAGSQVIIKSIDGLIFNVEKLEN